MTNHNIPTNTPETQQTPEQLRELDAGADVIDVARDLRSNIYSNDNEANLDNIFNDDETGEEGGYQLLELAARLRSENRTELTDFEQQFVDHMKQIVDSYKSESLIDIDAIPETDEDKDLGIKAIADKLKKRIQDEAPKVDLALVSKLYVIEEFLDLDTADDDALLESKFMSVHNKAQAATGAEKAVLEADAEDLADLLSEKANKIQKVINAYEVIAEYYPRTPGDTNDLDEDPRLAYEPSTQAPTEPTNPTAPQMTRRAKWAQDRAERNEEATAFIEQRKADFAEGVAMLGDEHMDEILQDHRNEVAEKKSQTVRNTLRSNKIGRIVMGALTLKTDEEYAAKVHETEHRYNAIVIEKIRRDNADAFAELPADATDAEKHEQLAKQASAIAKGIIAEQKSLRHETNESMKDKISVKAGKWMMDHKVITVAGATLLLPVLGGSAAIGLSVGLGALAGAKMDKKFRGLRETEKTLNYTKLFDEASRSHSVGGDVFKDMQEFAMNDLDSNVTRELFLKRVGALGTMGAVAVGGSFALSANSGSVSSVDYWIRQNQSFINWTTLGVAGTHTGYKTWKNKKKSSGGGH